MTLRNIARYEIQSEIGRGGMAVVYLAFDPNFRRKVAIKLVSGTLQEVATIRQRFEREAQLIARIEHPAIVPVYDFGEQEGQLYLVMRYMQGGSLAARIKAERLSLQQAAQVFTQIAPALDAVHAQGIVHRDLKPGNILLDSFGNPAISDFGIAHFTAATTDLTGSTVIGTPAYMSPEQVQAEKALDGRSDVYSLGVILFEMLTGRGPYHANTPMSVALKHLTEPIPSIRPFRQDIPERLDEILHKALAKDRELRYATASEMADDLRECAAELKESPSFSTAPPASSHGEETATEIFDFEGPPSYSDSKPARAGAKTPSPPNQNLPGSTTARTSIPSASNGLRIALVGGLVILIILICGSIGAFGTWAGLTGFFGGDNPTPTLETASTETIFTTAVQDVLLFADDFSDPNSGWPSGQNSQGLYGYLAGGYQIRVTHAEAVIWVSTDRVNDDHHLFVDVRTVSNSTAGYHGLLCRIRDENNFYYFVIRNNGDYTIGKLKDGEFQSFFAEGWRSSAFLPGGQVNHMQADCQGSALRLYVNDVLLGEATDSDFTSGYSGLVAASLDEKTYEVLFDNFITSKPGG